MDVHKKQDAQAHCFSIVNWESEGTAKQIPPRAEPASRSTNNTESKKNKTPKRLDFAL